MSVRATFRDLIKHTIRSPDSAEPAMRLPHCRIDPGRGGIGRELPFVWQKH